MSAVVEQTTSSSRVPAIPADLSILDTGHGTVRFHVAELRVHGVRVNIRTEVSGSGGGISYAGTGTSGMHIGSESHTVREFWLSPVSGSRDTRLELVDSDFSVADGHLALGLYSQAGDAIPDLIAVINLNTGDAYKIPESAAMKLHERYTTQFVGKSRGIGFVGWMLFWGTMGVSGWIWSKTGWKVGLPVFIGAYFTMDRLSKRVPAINGRLVDLAIRDHLKTQFTAGQYNATKWLDNTLRPRWVV